MRAEVTRLQEVIDGARSARPTVTGGARTGFNVIQVLVARTVLSRLCVDSDGAPIHP